jgi:hypothetical protein
MRSTCDAWTTTPAKRAEVRSAGVDGQLQMTFALSAAARMRLPSTVTTLFGSESQQGQEDLDRPIGRKGEHPRAEVEAVLASTTARWPHDRVDRQTAVVRPDASLPTRRCAPPAFSSVGESHAEAREAMRWVRSSA